MIPEREDEKQNGDEVTTGDAKSEEDSEDETPPPPPPRHRLPAAASTTDEPEAKISRLSELGMSRINGVIIKINLVTTPGTSHRKASINFIALLSPSSIMIY